MKGLGLKELLISKNIMLLVFCFVFILLYIASNTQNTAMGLIGILLTVLNAIVILAA